MARSFSNAKTVSAFIANEISAVGEQSMFENIYARGYAASSQGAVSSSVRNGAPSVMLKKGSEESTKTSWVPDPETGYFRPENQTKELDAAELRAMLLKNKNKGQ
ncbi:hypothetical protein BUALT_Bualt02G0236200 [Buddleja alternifolia]|uniref:Uncharacterized protein n=1 Tax=Buddleja alternifolia TaxID=168488 RepID=A0AAV6Y4X4_9LAMI|nr:hypothetical protein BUALT_Bualt02G0236200 [Buddleja alternifolia]